MPVDVNALILYDAVDMHFSVPDWVSGLPGANKAAPWMKGPPKRIPGNVQNFFHAQKTAGASFYGPTPHPTTSYGGANERTYGTRAAYREEQWAKYQVPSYVSSHSDIGVSPSATEAYRDSLEFAERVGIAIDTSDPYKHRKSP